VDLSKVVREVPERHGCGVILDLFAEGIRQPRVAPIRHPNRKVMTFYIAGADVLRLRMADHRRRFAADALRWAIAPLAFRSLAVNLLELRVIDLPAKGPFNRWQVHIERIAGELTRGSKAWGCCLNFPMVGGWPSGIPLGFDLAPTKRQRHRKG